MSRRVRVLLSLGGLIGLALVFVPAVAAGDPCYHGYTIPAVTTQATSTVKLEPCAFVPTITRIAPGDTVTFTNGSEFTHLVFGANATWGDRDAEIPAGGARSVRFDRPGTYPYSCALHRGMSGVIVVGDSGGSEAAAASTTTSGSDGGLGTTIALAGLGGLAVLGWGMALLQRRRATTPVTGG